MQKDLGAEEHILERDPSTGVCRLLYDSAPSGRFGSMTYLTKAVAVYVEDFLPGGSCAVQWDVTVCFQKLVSDTSNTDRSNFFFFSWLFLLQHPTLDLFWYFDVFAC